MGYGIGRRAEWIEDRSKLLKYDELKIKHRNRICLEGMIKTY
jgi:hypothetical protein